jgi:ribokinase
VSGPEPRFGVVVVGSVNRDHVCRVDVLPGPGQTVLGGEASVGSGGKGGNQAVAARLLGAPTALVARIGDDHDGQALVADLAAAGVDTGDVLALPGVRTGSAFVLVDAAGDNAIVVAPGANGHLDAATVEEALGRLLAPPAVLVTQAEIPPEAVAAAVATASRVGCRAVVNLAPYRPLPSDLLERCDPLVLNESEAGDLLGREVRGAEAARQAIGEIQRRTTSVVITVGADGALVGVAGEVHHVPAEGVEVVDTTGAGDAFTGALAAALSAGHDLVGAVRIGVRAGSYAVTGAGAQASYPDASALGLPPLRRAR